jgi:hypothetical protein
MLQLVAVDKRGQAGRRASSCGYWRIGVAHSRGSLIAEVERRSTNARWSLTIVDMSYFLAGRACGDVVMAAYRPYLPTKT